jgi:acyl carrier protein
MNEKELINILKKKFKHLKKKKINIKEDLAGQLILDSLELMGFMLHLEKKKLLKLKEYTKKQSNFKLLSILNYINNKK